MSLIIMSIVLNKRDVLILHLRFHKTIKFSGNIILKLHSKKGKSEEYESFELIFGSMHAVAGTVVNKRDCFVELDEIVGLHARSRSPVDHRTSWICVVVP